MSEAQTVLREGENVGVREQLFNGGETGPIGLVSRPREEVVSIRGVLIDLDLKLFQVCDLIPKPTTDPVEFYEQSVKPWLFHHGTLKKAEVRNSGGGLHVILRPKEPIPLYEARERQRWGLVIPLLQASLPSDSAQPDLNAYTRKIGSINEKNGAEVTLLKKPEPIDQSELMAFAQTMVTAPFQTIHQVLVGQPRSKCSKCGDGGVFATPKFGKCYCGHRMDIDDLLRPMFAKEVIRAS